jgi:hypothetical protein
LLPLPRAKVAAESAATRDATHEGAESARAKLFLKKQEPHTIYFLSKFTLTQKKQNKIAVHPEK